MTAVAVAKKPSKNDRDTSAFGARLRELREVAALSQNKLAELAGVSSADVSRYEAGKVEPGWTVVQKIAKALGVTPNDLADPPDE